MQPPITSLQNQRVKDAIKLRDRRQRDKQGRILIEGVREVALALKSGVELVEVFACEPLCQSVEACRVLTEIQSSGVPCSAVTTQVFEKLSFGDRHEGLIAVALPPRQGLPAHDSIAKDALIVVLEAVEKPGNVGAVLRSADAAGARAVILADPATDIYNAHTIRASLGTIFSMHVVAASAVETLAWLRAGEYAMFSARTDSRQPYTQASFRGKTAFILGSESVGLSDVWRASDVSPIRLPMHGAADSLNVSVAAAILLYEALRQREAN